MILLLIVCLALPAFAAHREPAGDVELLDAQVIRLEAAAKAGADIVIGNTNEPVNAVADWYYGREEYAVPVKEADVMACGETFSPASVTFYMRFGPEDVPATFTAQGVLYYVEEVDMDCFAPLESAATTPLYSVTVDSEGSYEIVLPFDEETAQCWPADAGWAVGLNLPDWFADGMAPDALTDADARPCTSWYQFYGLGWEDLVADYTWPGSLVLKMDANCCQGGVANEDKSWGDVKSIYR